MSSQLDEGYFHASSAQKFVHLLRDDLMQGRNLLLLVPTGVNVTRIWEKLRGELWHQDFVVREVVVTEIKDNSSPIAALGEILGVRWPEPGIPRTISNFYKCSDLPDIIRLEGIECLGEAGRKKWLDLIFQWAQIVQNENINYRSAPVFCVLASAVSLLDAIPKTNVKLSVRWWWGISSTLELRLVCRFQQDDEGACAYWREHFLSSLSGDEVSLASYLWDDVRLDFTDLVKRLQKFALDRGWSKTALSEWGVSQLNDINLNSYSTMPTSPPERSRMLWAHGAIHWTYEYGMELHTAALASLGRNEDVRHRIWRAQAASIFPILDIIRIKLCSHLTSSYGTAWPTWDYPEDGDEIEAVRNNPYACQWGHLKRLIKHCYKLRPEHRWLPIVERSQWIRNELAHNRPISFYDFEPFWQEMGKIKTPI
jgi:hypothetical protein